MLWRWMDDNTGKLCKYDDETGIEVYESSGCGRRTVVHQTKQDNYVALYYTSWQGERNTAALWSKREVLVAIALNPENATPAGLRLLEQNDPCKEV